jgi:hypothetical protein
LSTYSYGWQKALNNKVLADFVNVCFILSDAKIWNRAISKEKKKDNLITPQKGIEDETSVPILHMNTRT